MNDLKWTAAEKRVARGAFEAALQRECAAACAKLKKMTATASTSDDLWDIHDFLSDARKEIGDKYDYRYSVLIFVFARLLREGWLSDADLDGLGDDKMARIAYLVNQ